MSASKVLTRSPRAKQARPHRAESITENLRAVATTAADTGRTEALVHILATAPQRALASAGQVHQGPDRKPVALLPINCSGIA